MNKKSWLIALVALVLGAGAAVAITRGKQEDATVGAPPTDTTDSEKSKDSAKQESNASGDEADKNGQKAAEEQVEQTVNTYVEALEEGDTEALCNIQAESLTVNVTASGVSGEEIAAACAEAASQFDWAELWAAWASQIDLDDVQVDIDGRAAKVSLVGGASFSLDKQKSGEWKIDGLKLPGGGNAPSGGSVPSGGNVPSGGGGDLPSPHVPRSPQIPQSPQLPQSPRLPQSPQLPQR
jgi:ketosteroid isomerase-like protein